MLQCRRTNSVDNIQKQSYPEATMSLVETLSLSQNNEIRSGEHNPTFFIPGLGEPDLLLKPTALFFGRKGMVTTTSNIGINTGRVKHDVEIAEAHLFEFFEHFGGEAVTLVGHSLGGLYARILALRYPEIAKGVITVGSPSHQNPIESIRSFKLAGHVMTDLLYRFLHEYIDELREPIYVPEHHIYTPYDLIVNHLDHCEEGPYVHHRVPAANHFTLMVNPFVLRTLGNILPQNRS